MPESTGGGGGTAGLSTITGILNMGSQLKISRHRKDQAKLQRKHQALLNANAREQMKQSFTDLNLENKDTTRNIEQDAADRGIGDSSIKTDNQSRREVDFNSKKAALDRERAALESGIFTADKIYEIQNKIAKAQNAINMINSLSGGAAGVVDYYGQSGGPVRTTSQDTGGSVED